MIRSARLLIVVALCIALVSSLGMSAAAAPTSGDAPVASVAKKKKKKKRCRKGYVLKRVTIKSGKRKGKRTYKCVKWKRSKHTPRLSPAG